VHKLILLPLPEAEFCQKRVLEIIANSQIDPDYFELLVAFVYWNSPEPETLIMPSWSWIGRIARQRNQRGQP